MMIGQALQVKPHLPQVVGFRPANSASNPTGKKQIATRMTQAGYPAFSVIVPHFEQETAAIYIPPNTLRNQTPNSQKPTILARKMDASETRGPRPRATIASGLAVIWNKRRTPTPSAAGFALQAA